MLVEQRVWGVEFLGLPFLDSGHNSKLTSEENSDLRRQGVAVDDNDDSDPKTLLYPKTPPYHNWKIITVEDQKE